MAKIKRAIIAGSIGLDIIPVFDETAAGTANLFAQGKFNDMHGTRLYLGGCVGNTGIAMYKLGVPAKLISKVGDDLIGQVIRMILNDQKLPLEMKTVEGMPSSSTVVISPPKSDRVLLHSRGASQTFVADDLTEEMLAQADHLHFASPTAMKTLYTNEGRELTAMFKKAKQSGITISMDTSQPDPNSEPGRADWKGILQRTLPYTDVFLPSLEELLFMLHRDNYENVMKKSAGKNPIDYVELELIPQLAEELLEMGAKIVVLKLGKKGLYLRTASKEKIESMGRATPENAEEWAERELLFSPYYTENIRSTTGAGDNAIAGFLASFLRSDLPEHALAVASANALRCIESYETTDRTIHIEALDEIIAMKPKQEEAADISESYWKKNTVNKAFYGRHDTRG